MELRSLLLDHVLQSFVPFLYDDGLLHHLGLRLHGYRLLLPLTGNATLVKTRDRREEKINVAGNDGGGGDRGRNDGVQASCRRRLVLTPFRGLGTGTPVCTGSSNLLTDPASIFASKRYLTYAQETRRNILRTPANA